MASREGGVSFLGVWSMVCFPHSIGCCSILICVQAGIIGFSGLLATAATKKWHEAERGMLEEINKELEDGISVVNIV